MGSGNSRREDGVRHRLWENGVIQVHVPMAPPLLQMNGYVLRDEDGGLTVVDPGPRSRGSEKVWEEVLRELGASWKAVKQIVVTHHHPDHYGLAGWLQERSGCRVWMSKRAHAEAELMWGPASVMESALPAFFARHGMPPQQTAELKEHQARIWPAILPQPEVSHVEAERPFAMGGREWLPVETGGHAAGHLSFFHSGSGQLLCGDAVLPQISPNVSLLPGSDPEPLRTFMDGLSRLRELPVKSVFPGHREPFGYFADRIDWLLLHHEERLDAAESLLADGPRSGYEVCGELFRGRITGIHQLRFAMSEALAHLVELERRGRAFSEEKNGEIRFFRIDGC